MKYNANLVIGRRLWLSGWEWLQFRSCKFIPAQCSKILTGTGSEKLLKLDAKRREYDIRVIGEEPYLAYNRVGLSSYFQHRDVERLYMNPAEWVRDCCEN